MTAAAQHLHRIRYRTDAVPTDDRYPGVLSTTIDPPSATMAIVAIDWNPPGCVWVTYLVDGPSPIPPPRQRRRRP